MLEIPLKKEAGLPTFTPSKPQKLTDMTNKTYRWTVPVIPPTTEGGNWWEQD